MKALLSFGRSLVIPLLALVPQASLPADLDLSPPPGKAVIVVYRPAKIPGVLLQTRGASRVAYDEQWISALSKGEHFAFYAWPGQHKIESSIGIEREGTVQLDVKPGETYYISAGPSRPTPVSLVSSTGVAVALVDKETAEKELAASKPVEWAQNLLHGTFADVGTLNALPDNATACGPAEWTPDIDSMKTSSFKRAALMRGPLYITDEALVLKFGSEAADAVGVRVPVSDIASVDIKNKMMRRVVVVTRQSGRLDSFSVITSGGGRIDRDGTQSCGELLSSRLVPGGSP